MRKFLIFFILPVLTIALTFIKVPQVEAWITIKNPNSALYLGIAIAIITLIIHYLNVISPFKRYEKIERNKWSMVDAVLGLNEYFKDNNLSINVMVAKRCFINDRQPKVNKKGKIVGGFFRYRVFQKMFKVLWSYNDNPIDKRLVLTVEQGCSGMAFKRGKPVLLNFKEDGTTEMKLNKDQKNAISNLEFIISCPIFALDEQYKKLSDKVIGILNVSSSHPQSYKLIKTEEDRSSLTNKVVAFSKICSLIL